MERGGGGGGGGTQSVLGVTSLYHSQDHSYHAYLGERETHKSQPECDIEGSCHGGQLLVEVSSKLGIDTAHLIQGYEGCNEEVIVNLDSCS